MERNETHTWSVSPGDWPTCQKSGQYLQAFRKKFWKTDLRTDWRTAWQRAWRRDWQSASFKSPCYWQKRLISTHLGFRIQLVLLQSKLNSPPQCLVSGSIRPKDNTAPPRVMSNTCIKCQNARLNFFILACGNEKCKVQGEIILKRKDGQTDSRHIKHLLGSWATLVYSSRVLRQTVFELEHGNQKLQSSRWVNSATNGWIKRSTKGAPPWVMRNIIMQFQGSSAHTKKLWSSKEDNSFKDGQMDRQTNRKPPWIISNTCIKFLGPRSKAFWVRAQKQKIAKFKEDKLATHCSRVMKLNMHNFI